MPDYDQQLKNFARGGQSYRAHRQRIALLIEEMKPRAPKPISRFLDDKFFRVDPTNWVAIGFNDKDWRYLRKLFADKAGIFAPAYMSLATACIRANRKDIQEVYAFDASIAGDLISADFDAAAARISQMPGQSHKSLYAYRLTAALNSNAGEQLIDWFREQPLSSWMKQRFIYPFVYYYLNLPTDDFLDFHMSVAMPPGHENDVEKRLIEFLLRDEIQYEMPIAGKLYAGLVCHPFDLCEIILNHFEHTVTSGVELSLPELALVAELASIVPDWRMPAAFRAKLPILPASQPVPQVLESLALRPGDAEALAYCMSLRGLPENPPAMSKGVAAVWRMRFAKYPAVSDYETVVGFGRGYHGTVAGRLIDAIVTALFLMPRREARYETAIALRLASFIGAVDGFVATSPNGLRAIEVGLGTDAKRLSSAQATEVQKQLLAPCVTDQRCWIKKVHWELARLEREGRFREWMRTVLQEIPVAPAYLTGIDWGRFLKILDSLKVGTLRGDAAAAYCLLLHQIEERPRDSNLLRLVLEPVAAEARTLPNFVAWLDQTYGAAAVAFVRFFLTADNILWLDLAPNYTAALIQRVDMLDAQARKYGLDTDVLNEEVLVQEQRAMSTSLVMMNVAVNQFDVAWDVIARDAANRNAGIFEAYLAINPVDETDSLISLAKQEVPHNFPNGEARRYSIVSREFPLLNVVLGVIDTFMDHPAHGIESILSIRIRHNNFRREIIRALNGVAIGFLPDIRVADRQFLVPQFEDVVRDAVQSWLDERMHQRRAEKPDGYFDFIPSQDHVRQLLDRLAGARSFDLIAEPVLGWLREELASQVALARTGLFEDLRPALMAAIDGKVVALREAGDAIPALEATADLVKTAIGLRIEELSEWFATAAGSSTVEARYVDMAAVVEERYRAEVDAGQIQFDRLADTLRGSVSNDRVRLLFNLWSDLVDNVLRHSGIARPRFRVAQRNVDGRCHLVFSSSASRHTKSSWSVKGDPYKSPSEALFREGNTGLTKVASLAASILDAPVEISVCQGRAGFHVSVPLQPEEAHVG